MKKKEAVDKFIHILKVYNRINKTTLVQMTHSAIKSFNDAHPDMKIVFKQKSSLAKRIGGLIYNDLMHNNLMHNTKQVKKDE